MPEYSINVAGNAWELSHGDLTLRASDVKIRDGKVSCVLVIECGLENVFTDTVKLTSRAARKAIVKTLAGRDLGVDEPTLRALDDAIRSNNIGERGPGAQSTKRK